MTLSRLILAHHNVVAVLREVIAAGGNAKLVACVDFRVTEISQMIGDLHCISKEDIHQQIKFFLHRSHGLEPGFICQSDLCVIDQLLDRYSMDIHERLREPGGGLMSGTQMRIPFDRGRFEIKEWMEQSQARLTLLNTDFRYEYTSPSNGEFHSREPNEFVDLHVAEIIGEKRFEGRCRAYVEKCFEGQPQRYSYFLDVPGVGERLMDCKITPHRDMDCKITPHRDGDGCVRGALISMADISTQMEHASRHAGENVFQ